MTMTTTTAPSGKDKEEVLVLYASQNGNSEQAAKDIQQGLSDRFADTCSSKLSLLDDFLQGNSDANDDGDIAAQWTPLVIICVSSYGDGNAPFGGELFRELCDEILAQQTNTGSDGGQPFLKGVSFALLGLGDPQYADHYYENPNRVHKALTTAGATEIHTFGKADVSETDVDQQERSIQEWTKGLWVVLDKKYRQPKMDTNKTVNGDNHSASTSNGTAKQCDQNLQYAQSHTQKLVQELQDQHKQQEEDTSSNSSTWSTFPFDIAVVVSLVALGIFVWLEENRSSPIVADSMSNGETNEL